MVIDCGRRRNRECEEENCMCVFRRVWESSVTGGRERGLIFLLFLRERKMEKMKIENGGRWCVYVKSLRNLEKI